LSEERDEAASKERFLRRRAAAFEEANQFLLVGVSDGNDKAPAVGQLFDKRRRDGGRGGGHKNRFIRGGGGPAGRAVAFFNADIVIAEAHQSLADRSSQNRLGLDRYDFAGKKREDGSLIARAGANFKDALTAAKRKSVGHRRDDVGLRYGLTLTDGQRFIRVGFEDVLGRNEEVARDGQHRVEHARGPDAAVADLPGDHIAARAFEIRAVALSVISVFFHPKLKLSQRRAALPPKLPGRKIASQSCVRYDSKD